MFETEVSPNRTPPADGRAVVWRTEILGASFPMDRFMAIGVFGSVARGDAKPLSDIDLLFVSSAPMRPTAVLKLLPERVQSRANLFTYTPPSFNRMLLGRSLFAAHIQREAHALHDPTNLISALSRTQPGLDVIAERQRLTERLELYDDLQPFNGEHLFCLSHMYVLAKRTAMLALASYGIFEFNRESIFELLDEFFPESSQDLKRARQLKPFFHLVTDREPEELPFAPQGELEAVVEARESVRALSRLICE